jgi:EAL domain-containing protein (putative c-di-GMP-specific phosphodiesterase class I)
MLYERDPTRAERELLDTIERGGRTPAGRTAVQLHLSQLLPSNRDLTRLRIASRLFAPFESSHGVRIFPLSNGDVFVLGKDMPEDQVDNVVHRVRSLFERDPLTFGDFEDNDDPFVSWYAYEVDYQDLEAVGRNLLEVAEIRRKRDLGAAPPPEPVGPGDLETLTTKVQTLNIRPLLHRQAAIRVNIKQNAEILFEEVTVAMNGVRDAIAPGKDFFADRWIFQEFSRTLDQVLLSSLPQAPMLVQPPAVSVNLNLESVNSRPFRGLLNSLAAHQHMVVEVQVVDIFTNLSTYQKVRDTLRAQGHKILIDGLAPAILGAMDLSLLDPDYVKILWTAELGAQQHGHKGSELVSMIKDLGASRVILSRVESETAMIWGLSKGITAFQGRYMDAILGTVTMQKCPSSAACTLKACTGRRASVMGKGRMECPNPPWLDKVHTFSAVSMKGGR